MAVQVTSPMQLRTAAQKPGQEHLQATAKDLDDLTANANTTSQTVADLKSTVAQLQQQVAVIQARIGAGESVSAVVGNAANTGSSTLDFTAGILTNFTP
jgi:predicted  nucleic acid-binding Zn-ribbon protein